MVNASNEFKRLLEEGNRNYMEYADITLRDGTVLNLTNKELWNGGITIDDAVSSDNSFDVGAAIINKATLTINNIYEEFSEYDFRDAEVVIHVGLTLDEANQLVGRNYLTKSRNLEGFTVESATYCTRTLSEGNCTLNRLSAGGTARYGIYYDITLEPGGKYTFSFDVASLSGTWEYSVGKKYNNWSGLIDYTTISGSGKKSVTFNSPPDGWIRLYISSKHVNSVMVVKNAKLELGENATDWTLSPEDVRIEKLRKGTFAVDDPKYNGSIITLECLDNMRKFDRLYSESKLAYPATLGQIVWDACSECGVTLETLTFPHDDFVVAERPKNDAVTFREIISWAAQIAGCFCRCDAYGRLELKWYPQKEIDRGGLDGGFFDTSNPNTYKSGDSADGGSFNPWNTGYKYDAGTFDDVNNIHYFKSIYTYDVATDDVVITGVEILEKTKANEEEGIVSYKTGEPGYLITIDGNELIQKGKGKEISKWLGNQLIGLRFRKATLNHASDPTIEAGDVGYFMNRKQQVFPFLVSSTKFSTGSIQTTSSSAKTPERNSAERYSNSTRNYLENRENTAQKITEYDKSVQMLTNLITQSFGVFKTEDVQSDGSVIYYLHNKPTIAESKTIWKITADAFAVSTDGGKTWNAGMDSSGNAVVNVLSAIRIQAEWINAENLNAISANIGDWHIDDKAIYKDVRIGDIIYRVYFQPPLDAWPDKTWVLSCQKSEDGGKSFSGNFILYSNGDARFGDSYIYADGSADFGNGLKIAKTGVITSISENGKCVIDGSIIKLLPPDSSSSFDEWILSIDSSDNFILMNKKKYIFLRTEYVSGTLRLVSEAPFITESFLTCNGNAYFHGNISVDGTKPRVVDSEYYGKRLLYCYEMPSPMFGDIGQGITDANGQCVISIDDVFSETISPQIEYQVFLQKEGPGDIWVKQKEQAYFTVNGTPNLKFAWEIKAIQRDFEFERLDVFSQEEEKEGEQVIDYEQQYIDEIEELIRQNEEALYNETAQ